LFIKNLSIVLNNFLSPAQPLTSLAQNNILRAVLVSSAKAFEKTQIISFSSIFLLAQARKKKSRQLDKELVFVTAQLYVTQVIVCSELTKPIIIKLKK
jgi:hypothetical protein